MMADMYQLMPDLHVDVVDSRPESDKVMVGGRWGELQAGQVEDRERSEGLAGGVEDVLAERQISRCADDHVELHDGLAPGARDHVGAVGRCWSAAAQRTYSVVPNSSCPLVVSWCLRKTL